jgi:hypothetical protein
MQNKILLSIGVILIFLGIFKPDLSSFNLPVGGGGDVCVVDNYVTDAPADTELLEKAREIADLMRQSDDSTRSRDCSRLSSLYCDIATLIELDNDDMVIKDTSSIRQVNSIAGPMLRLNIKDKYPNLAELAKDLMVSQIGDEDVVLDQDTRAKAVEAFRALSWAFYEGSK